MSLSKDDKEWVKLIARELAFAVNKETLTLHIASCPHGKAILASKATVIGILIGSGLAGGGVIAVLINLFKGT